MKPTNSILVFFVVYFSGICFADDETEDRVSKNFKYAKDDWQSKYGEIIFSVMLFRHGDRYPFISFPTNPHTEYLKMVGMGNISKEGKVRAYKLGLWTRERYDHLIRNRPYSSDLLSMISAYYERSLISGQLFLAGLYPPTHDEEIWKANFKWQPIPLYTVPPRDRVLQMKEYCSRYNLEIERLVNSPEMLNFYNRHRKTIEYIAKHGESPISDYGHYIIRSIQQTSLFFDILHVQDMLGLETPKWAKEVYPRSISMQEIPIMYYKLHTYNETMKRLKAGPLLNEIINELKNKRDNPQSEKIFHFYSGHQSNIIALMDSMGVWDQRFTTYSSALAFELRKLGEEYIVTVSYISSENIPPKLMELPNCPGPCTLDRFIDATKSVIPDDWDKECENLTPNYNEILF